MRVRIRLQRVHFMPAELSPGVLYVSEEFTTAAHLCPCGCGSKVSTPLGPTDWTLDETDDGPSLFPSVGNWQLRCRSHYWIHRGAVRWARQWTPQEIDTGRQSEAERRREYYHAVYRGQAGVRGRLWRWIRTALGR